jgi:hypothetical protein
VNRITEILSLALLLVACGGSEEPAVEVWNNDAWAPLAVMSYTIDGKRDGQVTRAVATFGLPTDAHLVAEFEVSYDPQPVLGTSRWRYEGDPAGTGPIVERSMMFFGGQGEGPSLGGHFRLDQDGEPRFRIFLPLRPVSQPRYQ